MQTQRMKTAHCKKTRTIDKEGKMDIKTLFTTALS